jgi:hypothetical protein
VFLASTSLSRAILGEKLDIFAFQFAPIKAGAYPEAAINNNVQVIPVINPANPKETERCFKAAFSEIRREKIEIVIVLPFSYPDNIV